VDRLSDCAGVFGFCPLLQSQAAQWRFVQVFSTPGGFPAPAHATAASGMVVVAAVRMLLGAGALGVCLKMPSTLGVAMMHIIKLESLVLAAVTRTDWQLHLQHQSRTSNTKACTKGNARRRHS
jgi:hypothetical protein